MNGAPELFVSYNNNDLELGPMMMKLTVSGVTQDTVRYTHLWGFYVRGFKPWHHCFKCFYGTHERDIHREIENGVIELPEPTGFFYLCGVAPGKRSELWKNNLHLAVRPKEGAAASAQSVYGPVFTIENAEAIEIQGPIEQDGLEPPYARCKNFRFAAQMYPAAVLGPGANHNTIREAASR